MSFALVSHVAASGSSNGSTTSSIDTTGANLLIVAVGYYSGSTHDPTISDSNGNTWTSVSSTYYESNTGDHASIRIYYAYNPTVGSGHTFTVSATSTFGSFVAAAFSGATITNPKDVESGHVSAGSGTSDQPGSITPTQDNDLILSAWVGSDPVTSLAASGLTITDTVQPVSFVSDGTSLAYVVQTTATAVNPTWSWNNTTSKATAIAAFKAAAGGGGGGGVFNPFFYRFIAGR